MPIGDYGLPVVTEVAVTGGCWKYSGLNRKFEGIPGIPMPNDGVRTRRNRVATDGRFVKIFGLLFIMLASLCRLISWIVLAWQYGLVSLQKKQQI